MLRSTAQPEQPYITYIEQGKVTALISRRQQVLNVCLAFTKHDFQVLYAFRIALCFAPESLLHDGRLALLYL